MMGCASRSPQTRQVLDEPGLTRSSRVHSINFIPQPNGDCGPTALAMVMNWAGNPITAKELRPQVLTPEKKGTLPTNMISASRFHGLMAVQLASLRDIVHELEAGHPVVVLQNLGLSWAPNWHYAVVVGYDLERQQFLLYSGDRENLTMPMTYFERHWQLANHWALVVLPPNEVALSAGELANMKAAAGLEAAQKISESVQAYHAILQKWPRSLGAHIGLSNVSYQNGNLREARRFLQMALKIHPDSHIVQNNLQIVEAAIKAKQ